MTDDIAQIQQEIDSEKAALANNLSELEVKAREVTDWRVQVRKHPLGSVGVALAAGVAVAMLARKGTPRVHTPHDGNGNGNGAAPSGASPWSHPVVDRVVNALVAVAAAKAVEMISESLPDFAEHLKAEPATPTAAATPTPPGDTTTAI